MKKILTKILSIFSILVLSSEAFAATGDNSSSTANSAPARADASTKGTSFSFDDLLIKGKNHFSDEAIVTVEDDKILDALLQLRKDFDDRLDRSAKQY